MTTEEINDYMVGFDTIIRKSKCELQAWKKIYAVKTVPYEVALAFAEKFNPEGKLTSEQAFTAYYNEIKRRQNHKEFIVRYYRKSESYKTVRPDQILTNKKRLGISSVHLAADNRQQAIDIVKTEESDFLQLISCKPARFFLYLD